MSYDLVDRLRALAVAEHDDISIACEAADEIERMAETIGKLGEDRAEAVTRAHKAESRTRKLEAENALWAAAKHSSSWQERAETAEARSVELEQALESALAEHNHRKTMQMTLTEPNWVKAARGVLISERRKEAVS